MSEMVELVERLARAAHTAAYPTVDWDTTDAGTRYRFRKAAREGKLGPIEPVSEHEEIV